MNLNLTEEQNHANELLQKGVSICVTGPAGCGKTVFIKTIKSQNKKVACTALTGVAATLIDGQTIHRWILKPSNWIATDILIIDEISMLSCEFLEDLDQQARRYRGEPDTFFGGLQLVLCGDFAQLPPIAETIKYCFESPLWSNLTVCHFTKIFRQGDDIAFQQILQEIRLGIVTENAKQLLNSRIIKDIKVAERVTESGDIIKPTMLFPYKSDVDKINHRELDNLSKKHHPPRTIHNFKAVDKGDSKTLDSVCNATESLKICVGSQVMLIVNLDVEMKLVNGTRGVVTDIDLKKGIEVIFEGNIQIRVQRFKFKYENLQREQYPLVLSWAMTIHKCQGTTLTNVVTDLRNVFSDSQIYVTLSRIRDLQSLFLLGINFAKIKCDPKVADFYSSSRESSSM